MKFCKIKILALPLKENQGERRGLAGEATSGLLTEPSSLNLLDISPGRKRRKSSTVLALEISQWCEVEKVLLGKMEWALWGTRVYGLMNGLRSQMGWVGI